MSETITWREIVPRWRPRTRAERPPGAPAVLGDFLAAGGRVTAVNSRDQVGLSDRGRGVFMIEDQAVFRWDRRPGDPTLDPDVYVRAAGSPAWSAVGTRLDAFLSAASVIEAVLRAPAQLTAVGPAAVIDEYFLHLPALDLPDLGWAGLEHHWYGNGDLLAFAQFGSDARGRRGGDAWVFLGAGARAALAPVARRLARMEGWETIT